MIAALFLALGQFTDPQIWRILVRSLGLTLLVFIAFGAAVFLGFGWLLDYSGVDFGFPFAEIIIVLALSWLLWRIVALAVLQFFADEVVAAVEARHYPQHAAAARKLGWREELAKGLGGAGRALAWNLAAVPVALVLLVTGIGAPLVFFLVNAVLLGRELQDMVWLRHRPTADAPAPLTKGKRLLLGGIVTALLTVPFVNFLAPFLGAAAATHLIHRKEPSNAA